MCSNDLVPIAPDERPGGPLHVQLRACGRPRCRSGGTRPRGRRPTVMRDAVLVGVRDVVPDALVAVRLHDSADVRDEARRSSRGGAAPVVARAAGDRGVGVPAAPQGCSKPPTKVSTWKTSPRRPLSTGAAHGHGSRRPSGGSGDSRGAGRASAASAAMAGRSRRWSGPRGFSQTTCLPAASIRSASRAWLSGGVVTMTRSISG